MLAPMEGGFGLFGDPDDLQARLGELAESMQGAQKVAWADNAPNSNVPTPMPTSPGGSSRRSSAGSRSRHSCCSPVASMSSSSGSMIAAACGTGTTSASSGVASAPKPDRKPLLPSPISSTAGTASA